VVDVAGHGVAAALLTVPISRALSPTGRSSLLWQGHAEDGRRVVPPAEVAAQLNRAFPWDPTTRQFFTLVYGVLNLRTLEWRYVSAGHPAPIHLPRDAATPVRLTGGQGVAIGLAEGGYQEGVVTLRPGDRLYLYSDGIPEAMNAERLCFGYERMMAALAETRGDTLTDSVASLWRGVEAWCEGTRLQDDVSLLCLEIADRAATATG
jgi:sigma-B regulation protein RsbU (phosphoserine phosphatase)